MQSFASTHRARSRRRSTNPIRIATTIAMLLVVTGSVIAQFPEVHYIRFNEAGGEAVIDHAVPGIASSPTLGPDAIRFLGPDELRHPVTGTRALLPGNGPGDVCATNVPLDVTGEWTLEMWIRDTVNPLDNTVAYAFGDPSAGGLRAFRGGVAGPSTIILRGTLQDVRITGIPFNEWCHVAWVYDGMTITPYLNGVEKLAVMQTSGPVDLVGTSPSGLLIGGYDVVNSNWRGRIDEVRLWNHARSADQIASLHECEIAVVQSYPWVETFDQFRVGTNLAAFTTDLPRGWTQTRDDGANNWRMTDDPTSTVGTGPLTDHTTQVENDGYYAYIEDSLSESNRIEMVTPLLDLSAVSQPELAFWIHSQSGGSSPIENTLSIDVLIHEANGAVITDANVIAPIGHLSSLWSQIVVPLSAYVGETIQIRFRGRTDNGSDDHDIALDDIVVREATDAPSLGQAARPGLALFDVNHAVNASGDGVRSFVAGPFFTRVVPEGRLEMTFEGNVNKKILLLAGPLNPCLGVLPLSIGKLDIGSSFDPITNTATDVSIIASGFDPLPLGAFFDTGPTGTATINLPVTGLPPGLLAELQAIIYTDAAPFIALTNAVRIEVE